MKLKSFAIACSLTLGLSAAPAFAIDKETRQMMADIRMLQEQSQQLQNLIALLTDTVKTIDGRLTTRIDDQTNTTRKAMADQKLTIDTVSNDLRVLREKVDDNNVRVGSLTQEVDALRQLVTQMNASRTTFLGPDDASAGALPPDAGAAPTGTAPTAFGGSPQKGFESALADYYGSDYALAISGFEAYIRNFPKSDQADNAQLYICNAYLADAKYDKAVEACDQVIRTYPTGDALPEAYYKKGVGLQSLKRSDEARDAFETLIKNYPDTDPARLATQRLPEVKNLPEVKKP